MRKLLAGERSDEAGAQVRSKGFRLAFPPPEPSPKLHLAALNPAMLALAGEVADGVWLNYVPVDRIGTVVGIVRDRGRGRRARLSPRSCTRSSATSATTLPVPERRSGSC